MTTNAYCVFEAISSEEGEEWAHTRNRLLVTRRDRILNEFYIRSANESAIARFVHHIFLIDRSIHFFFLVVPWYLKSISLFLAVPLLRKKIEKENQIIGTNTLFKYTYTSNFCATFRSVILSIPFRVLSFPNLSRYRCTLCNETFWPAEVSVGSRSTSRAKFTEKSRAARPYVILFSFTHGSGNRSISIRGREPAPDADFNQTIARRIDHSISFDVR